MSACISSFSQRILKVGDWTLPADLALDTCLHKRGETLKPIKWSNILLAKYASTRSWSISLGDSIAFLMAEDEEWAEGKLSRVAYGP